MAYREGNFFVVSLDTRAAAGPRLSTREFSDRCAKAVTTQGGAAMVMNVDEKRQAALFYVKPGADRSGAETLALGAMDAFASVRAAGGRRGEVDLRLLGPCDAASDGQVMMDASRALRDEPRATVGKGLSKLG